MTYLEFKKKWIGKSIDWDGYYGGQCFDVYRQYCSDLGLGQSPKVTGAKDIWTSYLTEDFDKIENTPDGIPKQGDVIIWGTIVGQYGHVAIFDNGDVNSFTSIDQNWPVDNGTGVLHEVKHTYNGVLGWLRPKVNDIIQEDMTDEQKKVLDKVEAYKISAGHSSLEGAIDSLIGCANELPKRDETISNQKKEIETLKKENEEYEINTQLLIAEITQYQKEIAVCQKEQGTAKKEIETLTKERNDYQRQYNNKCAELRKLQEKKIIEFFKNIKDKIISLFKK